MFDLEHSGQEARWLRQEGSVGHGKTRMPDLRTRAGCNPIKKLGMQWKRVGSEDCSFHGGLLVEVSFETA